MYEPKDPIDSVYSLYIFLISDMWHCFEDEFKSEEDMVRYLRYHFDLTLDELENMKRTNWKHEK